MMQHLDGLKIDRARVDFNVRWLRLRRIYQCSWLSSAEPAPEAIFPEKQLAVCAARGGIRQLHGSGLPCHVKPLPRTHFVGSEYAPSREAGDWEKTRQRTAALRFLHQNLSYFLEGRLRFSLRPSLPLLHGHLMDS
jgi:hypothetical protein